MNPTAKATDELLKKLSKQKPGTAQVLTDKEADELRKKHPEVNKLTGEQMAELERRKRQYIDNHCAHCGKSPNSGIYLINDTRGAKVCNKCKEEGLLIRRPKLNKAMKKHYKKMKHEALNARKAQHENSDSR